MKEYDRTPLTRLSGRSPGIPTLENLYAIDLVISLKEFLYENFRGLAALEIGSVDSTVVKISTEYLAYTLKELLKAIDGRAFVDIKASSTPSEFNLIFEIDTSVFITKKEQLLIFSAAKNAGFELHASKYGFTLRADAVQKQRAAFVYANSPELTKRTLIRIFFE
jgi:hypothetical protein